MALLLTFKEKSEKLYHKKITEYKNQSKKTRQLLNNVTNKVKNKYNIIDHTKVPGIDYFGPIEIAKQFGKYFSAIGTYMEKGIPRCAHNVNHYISKIPYCDRAIFYINVHGMKYQTL